jgi:hypothetical protein
LNGEPKEFGIIGSNLEGYYNKLTWLCDCAQSGAESPCTPETALPELKAANYILNNIPVKRFDQNSIKVDAVKEKRLKVEGLDAVMINCFNSMLLPSEMNIVL